MLGCMLVVQTHVLAVLFAWAYRALINRLVKIFLMLLLQRVFRHMWCSIGERTQALQVVHCKVTDTLCGSCCAGLVVCALATLPI